MRRAAGSLALVGLLSMLGQVALLRELAVASFGVELVFLAGTALWLAAGAAGAVAAERLGARRRRAPGSAAAAQPRPDAAADRSHGAPRGPPAGSVAALAPAFALLAVLLPAEVAFLRGSRLLLGGVPGAYLPLGPQVATAALGLVPAGAVLGWLFQRGAAALAATGGSLAAAYAWESAGGVAGSVAATAALAAGVPNLALVLACAAASVAVAAAPERPPRGGDDGPDDRAPGATQDVLPGSEAKNPSVGARAGQAGARPAWQRAVALALAAALAASLPFAPALDRWTTGWTHPLLADVVDTPYGRVAVVETSGQVVAFENDALAYDSEGTEAEPLAHAAVLQAPPGARALLLGGAAGGLVREVRKHRPARVVAVEVNAPAFRRLVARVPAVDRAALAAADVEVRFEDPRAFLRRTAERFDVILVGAAEPASGQANRFYTVEFFRRCALRLAPGGVLGLRLPSAENFWTPGQLRRNGAVHAALREVFPHVLVLPGAADVLLASPSPLERDPAVLGERLRARGVEAREVTPEYVRYVLENDRAAELDRRLRASGAAPNRDGRPVCYQQTALLWLGRIAGGAQDARLPGRGVALAVVAALVAAALGAAAVRRARPVALVAAASMAGMMIEGAVLLRYQAEAGALYRDLGLLLTTFMAGLVAGAAGFDRARVRAGVAGRRWGALALAALAGVAAAVGALGYAGISTGLPLAAVALAATGALVAAVFAAASQPGAGPARAGALYAADLVGGCAGSLLAALLLVLVLGVDGTALAAAALAAAAVPLAWRGGAG